MSGAELPLPDGDVTVGLVRVGDTVRRPRSPVSSAVEHLLQHLETAGFDGAPRFLGRDAQGRDVLTFVEGQVAGRPWPSWIGDPDRAASVGALLRRYHDAVAPLGVPEWAAAIPVPPAPPVDLPAPELIGHRDVTPENVVFRDGAAAALIDFDLLRPASRVEDLANVLLWWAPWMPAADREPPLRDADHLERARRVVDAYGLDDAERAALAPVSLRLAERSWHLMRWRAEHEGGGWARMWDEGVGDRILRRQSWLRSNLAELGTAVEWS